MSSLANIAEKETNEQEQSTCNRNSKTLDWGPAWRPQGQKPPAHCMLLLQQARGLCLGCSQAAAFLLPPAFLFLLAWPAGRQPPGRPLARLSKPIAVMPSSGRPGPVSPGRCCLGFSEAGLAHLHWLAWVMLLGLHSLWLRVFFTVTMSTWCCYPCSCNAARMHQALRSSICCSVRNPDFPSLLFSALVLQRVCLWWPVGEQGCRLEDLLCYSHTGRQEIHNVPGTLCSHHTWELHVPQKAKHAARPKGSPAAPIACLN